MQRAPLSMDVLLHTLERSLPSVWIRESLSIFAFPTILALHTVGLGFLAGPSIALDLRILGVASRTRLAAFAPFLRLMWAGFWLNLATGLALFVAYPTKAVTNPVFWVKLTAVAVGVWVLHRLAERLEGAGEPSPSTRGLAALSLVSWTTAIVLGRLLAYTYNTLLTYLD